MSHTPAIHIGQCQTLADVQPCPDCDLGELRPEFDKGSKAAKLLRKRLAALEAEQSRLVAEAHQRRYGVRP
jgi:hypothetical protein